MKALENLVLTLSYQENSKRISWFEQNNYKENVLFTHILYELIHFPGSKCNQGVTFSLQRLPLLKGK